MTTEPRIESATPEDLLGYLNETERKNAPATLYFQGNAQLLALPRVSIVGSRNASPEALRRAARLSTILARHDVVVVSGLALGIDAAAHRAAIAADGNTIAVLGTPLDRVYPAEHAELQRQIARDHLAVSQFATGQAIGRWAFPARNRVMALLSHATVIVEAGETSGTLSQGWEALRLGRSLFIMRSVVDNPDLQWPRKMLDYGAMSLDHPELVLDVLPDAGDTLHAGSAF